MKASRSCASDHGFLKIGPIRQDLDECAVIAIQKAANVTTGAHDTLVILKDDQGSHLYAIGDDVSAYLVDPDSQVEASDEAIAAFLVKLKANHRPIHITGSHSVDQRRLFVNREVFCSRGVRRRQSRGIQVQADCSGLSQTQNFSMELA